MKARISRLHAESLTLPPNLPPRASRWLLALYGAGVFASGTILLFWILGLTSNSFNGPYWAWQLTLNWVIGLSFLSLFLVQVTAFVGLALRRDWGRGLARVACAYWLWTLVGVIPAAVVLWVLSKRWNYNRTGREPEVPGWVEIYFGVGTGLVLGWLVFSVALDLLLTSIFAGLQLHAPEVTAASIVVFGAYLGLGAFILQGAALYGLLCRSLWGREAATLAAIALMFTVVAIPFSYLALKQMWPVRLAEASPAPA